MIHIKKIKANKNTFITHLLVIPSYLALRYMHTPSLIVSYILGGLTICVVGSLGVLVCKSVPGSPDFDLVDALRWLYNLTPSENRP